MKLVSKIFNSCLLLVLLTVGCAENGEPGPQGEQGEKGDPGSVDIIYSAWSQLDWNLNDSPTYLAHTLEVNELTNEFFENGGILLMFIKFESYVYPMPFSAGNDFVYFEIALPGELTIYVGTDDGSGVESFLKDGEYRYILIPGGSNINGRTGAVDLADYKEIKNYYNLPD